MTLYIPYPCNFFLLFPKVLQPQVQSLVTSSQVQPVTIQQQVQTVQAQRVLTQTANGTLQTLAPATVQTVAAPQVQQVPVGGLKGIQGGTGGDSVLFLGRHFGMLRWVIKSVHKTAGRPNRIYL